MKYDGVVIRLEELYLFILNPETMEIMDGVNISEHECYKDLRDDQLMVVDVIFKDGTLEIDKIDLDEFIYGETYGTYDVFIHIQDIMLFTITDENTKSGVSLSEIIDNDKINDIAIGCIKTAKKEKEDQFS